MLTFLQLKRTTSMQSKRITHTAKKRRRIIASSESNDAEIDDFPHWAKGTVWVELSQDLNCHYQLHKAVLERNSTWFAEELGRTLVEPGGLRRSYLKEIVRYLFRLDPVDGSKEPLLRRTVSCYNYQRNPVTYAICRHSVARTGRHHLA